MAFVSGQTSLRSVRRHIKTCSFFEAALTSVVVRRLLIVTFDPSPPPPAPAVEPEATSKRPSHLSDFGRLNIGPSAQMVGWVSEFLLRVLLWPFLATAVTPVREGF